MKTVEIRAADDTNLSLTAIVLGAHRQSRGLSYDPVEIVEDENFRTHVLLKGEAEVVDGLSRDIVDAFKLAFDGEASVQERD